MKNWTSEFDPSTGKTDNTLGDGVAVQAEVREPTMPRMTTGPEGGESEVDVEIYISDEGAD